MRIFGFVLAIAFALVTFVIPTPSSAQLYVSISAPPPLQMDMQPQLSNPNYIWTPGYWARSQYGYYWVAGSWTQAPQPGYLWTPGYWGYAQNQYNYNQGYWGPQVGYYGGINYGNGYYGNGYYGGNWQGNMFRYNTAVSRVNPNVIRNVYINRTVINRTVNRTSYNGGHGGIVMRPGEEQLAYARQHHVYATPAQRQRAIEASNDRHNFATVNRSESATHIDTKPPVKAAAKPAGHPDKDRNPNAKPGNKPPA